MPVYERSASQSVSLRKWFQIRVLSVGLEGIAEIPTAGDRRGGPFSLCYRVPYQDRLLEQLWTGSRACTTRTLTNSASRNRYRVPVRSEFAVCSERCLPGGRLDGMLANPPALRT